LWDKVGPEVARLFEQVVQEANLPRDWRNDGRYPQEVEAFLERRLKQLLYEPMLASGGGEEVKTALRLARMAGKLGGDKGAGLMRMLARKYRELLGRYYIFKTLSDPVKAVWEKHKTDAKTSEDVEMFRVCETVLKGIPQAITDFVVEPLFVLVRVNGTRERVVRIRSVHGGTTGPLRWPSEQLSSPKAMRIWLNDNANCANWAAGERELNLLGMDMGQVVAEKEVTEVPLRGHHHASGIWFFADGAFLDGVALWRDGDGVYWHQGKGYLPGEKDQEGDCFRMGPKVGLPGPFMHPVVAVTRAEVQGIFRQFAQDMHDAVGGPGGWLALGAALAHFAAKEMFEAHTAVPGMWVSAEPA
jgi:hypothetical protein